MNISTLHRLFLLLAVMLFLPGTESQAEELFVGDIYLAGTNRGTLLFRQRNSVVREGKELILRHTYTEADGELAVREDVIFEDNKFKKYIVEFRGTDCGCVLDRKEDKVVFSFTRGDTGKTGEANYTSNLVMGPTLTRFVHGNWDDLVQGKTAFFFLPAMNLQRVAQFRMYANTKSVWNRPGVIVLTMDLASVFLRFFVDPVDLVYDLRTKRLVEIHGKSLLQRRVNGRIENPVVDIYYRYGDAR